VSAFDARLSALSQLNHARDEVSRAGHELQEIKHGLGLLGVEVGGIDRALDAIAQAGARVHVARCTLWGAVSDEMRSAPCA